MPYCVLAIGERAYKEQLPKGFGQRKEEKKCLGKMTVAVLPQRSSLNEQYTSKLDDFESYIARAKLAPLSLHKLEDATEENALQQGLSQRCGRAEAPSAVCHRLT